ncbi:hypothetical protein JCM8097_001423 [Rhodosporidiobolus ruineniae]
MPVDYNRRFEQIAQDQQRQQQRREAERLQQQRQQAEQNARRFRQQQREREAADTAALLDRTLAQLHHHHAQSRVPNLAGWASLSPEDDDLGGFDVPAAVRRSPPGNGHGRAPSSRASSLDASDSHRPPSPDRVGAGSPPRYPSPPPTVRPRFLHFHAPSGGHSVHYPPNHRPSPLPGPHYPWQNHPGGDRELYSRESSSQNPGSGRTRRPGSTDAYGTLSLGKSAGEGGYRRAAIYGF